MRPLLALLLAAAALGSHTTVRPVGNDTDGVIARGLFPLGGHNPPLALLSDTVRVRLGPNGLTTTRVYWLRNEGASAAVRLATICGANQLDLDCGQVQIGASSPPSHRSIGYLVDSGGFVAIKQKTRAAIEACLKTVDGTICGHEWSTFAIDMQAGESLRASLQYQTPFNERYWIESVVEPLHLYTEKFWHGDSVPHVTVWVEVQGGSFTLRSWTPRGLYAPYSLRPTGEVDGAVYWRLDGHRPVKKQYTYLFRLLHPWSVDRDQIRAAYDEAMAKTGSVRRQDR
jgi:hypothetical protein